MERGLQILCVQGVLGFPAVPSRMYSYLTQDILRIHLTSEIVAYLKLYHNPVELLNLKLK